MEPTLITNATTTYTLQAQNIINIHVDRRRDERIQDPVRFDMKPTLGEKARRSVPPITPSEMATNSRQHTGTYHIIII